MPGTSPRPVGDYLEKSEHSIDGAKVAVTQGYKVKLELAHWQRRRTPEGIRIHFSIKHQDSVLISGEGYCSGEFPDEDSARREYARLCRMIEEKQYSLELGSGGKISLKFSD